MLFTSLFIFQEMKGAWIMELRKFNRNRCQVITFTDSRGIEREVEVIRDDLKNAKKPPAWMRELMRDLEELEQERKGA